MDMKKRGKVITSYYLNTESTDCWTSIENLIKTVYYDLAYFALCHKHYDTGCKPVMEKWIYASHNGHQARPHSTKSIIHEQQPRRELENIRSINSRNGGTDEAFIHPFPNLDGHLHIVFLDSIALDEKTSAQRRTTINSLLPHLTSGLLRWLQTHRTRQKGKILTKREFDVLHWIKEGKSTWEVAIILGIKDRTVKYHLNNIYKKLDSTNRTQAVSTAIKLNRI